METGWFLSCSYYLTFDQTSTKLGGDCSLMIKNMLKYLIELRETVYLLDYQFIIKRWNSEPGRCRHAKDRICLSSLPSIDALQAPFSGLRKVSLHMHP